MKKVTIYTDGSCTPNPGKGGWAAILRYGKRERILCGSDPHTTNNKMEMTAALEALRALKTPCEVILYTDSNYLVKTFNQNWKRRKNHDLWEALDKENSRHKVTWAKVKAHANNVTNNRVDRLAKKAADGLRCDEDT